MIFAKKERVKFLRGISYIDGPAFGPGDVAELEPAQARAVVDNGVAEPTTEPVGSAPPTPYMLVACPRCSFLNSEWALRCENGWCGLRFI